jgi:hypothetical protein
MKPDLTTVDLVLGLLALGFTGLWLVACICYAHCRGDAEIGVADTQGRTNSEDAKTRSEGNPSTK